MRLGRPVTIVLFTITLIAATNSAEATIVYHNGTKIPPKIDGVGIYIEKSCQMNPKCVSYTDIKKFDNSPKTIGKLITHDNATKRVYTPIQNNPEWLRFAGNDTIVVDPPSLVAEKLRIITIKNQLDVFIKPDQYKVSEYENRTDAKPTHSIRLYSHTWDVSETCKSASITTKDWQVLLPQMIEHLRSNCHTPIEKTNITKDIQNLTKHDIRTTSKYKIEKWQDYIKKNCLQKRNQCQDLMQPTRAGLK